MGVISNYHHQAQAISPLLEVFVNPNPSDRKQKTLLFSLRREEIHPFLHTLTFSFDECQHSAFYVIGESITIIGKCRQSANRDGSLRRYKQDCPFYFYDNDWEKLQEIIPKHMAEYSTIYTIDSDSITSRERKEENIRLMAAMFNKFDDVKVDSK